MLGVEHGVAAFVSQVLECYFIIIYNAATCFYLVDR